MGSMGGSGSYPILRTTGPAPSGTDSMHCGHVISIHEGVKHYENALQSGAKLQSPTCAECNDRALAACVQCGPEKGYCETHLRIHAASRNDLRKSQRTGPVLNAISHSVFATTTPLREYKDHYCLLCLKCDQPKGQKWVAWRHANTFPSSPSSRPQRSSFSTNSSHFPSAIQDKHDTLSTSSDNADDRNGAQSHAGTSNNKRQLEITYGQASSSTAVCDRSKLARGLREVDTMRSSMMNEASNNDGNTMWSAIRKTVRPNFRPQRRAASCIDASSMNSISFVGNSVKELTGGAVGSTEGNGTQAKLPASSAHDLMFPKNAVPPIISEEKQKLCKSLSEMDEDTRLEALKCLSPDDAELAEHHLPNSPLIGTWVILKSDHESTAKNFFTIVMTPHGLKYTQQYMASRKIEVYGFLRCQSKGYFTSTLLQGEGVNLRYFLQQKTQRYVEISIKWDPLSHDKLLFTWTTANGKQSRNAVREGGPEDLSIWSHVGLRNSGNTCYINGAVQFLSAMPRFLEPAQRINGGSSPGPITTELMRLCNAIRDEKGVETTDKLVRLIQAKLPPEHAMYNSWHAQHDAEEFLRTLLNVIQTECHEEATRAAKPSTRASASQSSCSASPRRTHVNDARQNDDAGSSNGAAKDVEKVAADDTNHGGRRLKNLDGILGFDITCGYCGHKLIREQQIFGVYPLNIPSEHPNPMGPYVPDLVHAAMEAEEIEGYPCTSCKRAGKVKQHSYFKDIPQVLAVHLIRNEWDPVERNGGKVRTPVRFPQFLELDLVSNTTITPVKLELLAVLNHEGNDADRGHYTCYRKKGLRKWALADDGLTREAAAAEITKCPTAATMLLYQTTCRKTENITVST
eukprot:GEMP01004180.1.p1 GENE.GEMP01004180.1~~GEMP01004180.1.p1  ORF type:complete len:857 (+),score=171.28 GEMP01004180.1:46-2616(+)